MTDDWGDIDQGWEEAEPETGRKKRTRARGKTRRAAADRPSERRLPTKKPKPHLPKQDQQRRPTAKKRRPWLLPLLAFIVGIIVIGLFLVAKGTD